MNEIWLPYKTEDALRMTPRSSKSDIVLYIKLRSMNDLDFDLESKVVL